MTVGETETADPSLPESSPELNPAVAGEGTVFAVLIALSVSHLLNDTIQSLIPAMYPILAEKYLLNFTQIGLITFAFQCTASLLQPIVGLYTDRRPKPFSLAAGMGMTLLGLCVLAVASNFTIILLAAALVGIGSAVFHPESSRVARMASGGQHGLAQSLFQVGGNAGSALGPLLAAFIVVPRGQASVAWFSIVAVCGITLLIGVGRWYHNHLSELRRKPKAIKSIAHHGLSRGRVALSVAILLCLVFSKYFYLTSLTSYYTFYLIKTFGVSVEWSQIYLFVFLGAVAVGTFGGGPVGDRLGFKTVIWGSILGVLPFTLILPHVNLFWTVVLTVPIGLILASAFSAIMVYAQELLPSRVGMVAGLFFGFAFGMGGIGSAVLGYLADRTSIQFVYFVCSFLPAIGLLTAFLPNFKSHSRESIAKAPSKSPSTGERGMSLIERITGGTSTSALVAVGIVCVMLCGCGGLLMVMARRSVTSSSISPDGRWEAAILDRDFPSIDRNFRVRLKRIGGDETRLSFSHSNDENPTRKAEERIVWSPDSSQFAVVGKDFYSKEHPVLPTGEKFYLLCDVATGKVWCNDGMGDCLPLKLDDAPWLPEVLAGDSAREPSRPVD